MKSFMFGDNQSVVTSLTIPHSKLHKRHTALSYHRVCEAIASGVVVFAHIPGNTNPADIFSNIGPIHRFGLCSRHSCSIKVTPWHYLMMPNCMLHILGLGQFRQMGSSNVPKGNLFVCPPVPYMLHFYIYLCGTESMLKNYPETVVLSVLYSTGGIVQDIPFCNLTTMYFHYSQVVSTRF